MSKWLYDRPLWPQADSRHCFAQTHGGLGYSYSDVVASLPDGEEDVVIGLPPPDFGDGRAALVVMRQGAARDGTVLMHGIGARPVERPKLRETHETLFTGSRTTA